MNEKNQIAVTPARNAPRGTRRLHQTSNIKHPVNPHAKALGKLGKGKPKTLTLAERRRRADRLAAARLKRWEPKQLKTK